MFSRKDTLVAVVGSRAIGLNDTTSDLDIVKVTVAPVEWYIGNTEYSVGRLEYVADGVKTEETEYDFRRFVSLIAKGSPNLLPILFSEYTIRKIGFAGQTLIENRDKFVTVHAVNCFAAMAYNIIAAKKAITGKLAASALMISTIGVRMITAGTAEYPLDIMPLLSDIRRGSNIADAIDSTKRNLGEIDRLRPDATIPQSVGSADIERIVVNGVMGESGCGT